MKRLFLRVIVTAMLFTPVISFSEHSLINSFHVPSTLSLNPIADPVKTGTLSVSSLHSIYYEVYGNPKGIPVVVLHGGPGATCTQNITQVFDLDAYQVIMFDQRGAYRSTPFGEMKDNTTQNLIADIEKLRNHLEVDKWVVFGGSWGSALALAYGETYPEHCLGFLLRGIFLGTMAEANQLLYGMKDIYPEYWQEMVDYLPAEEHSDLASALHKRLMDPDPKIHMSAARALMKYDIVAATLTSQPEELEAILANDKLILGIARTFIHYAMNNFFFEPNQLLNQIQNIEHLPAYIVHGRYDLITRAQQAFKLHKHWAGSKLYFASSSGHSFGEPQIQLGLLAASEVLKERLS